MAFLLSNSTVDTIRHRYFRNSSVLVLNASYEAINICNTKRAIIMILKGIAVAEENTHKFFHSPSFKIPVPSVIRINRYVRIKYQVISFTRKNIFLRDNFTCYYCNKIFKSRELTLDHVLPKSKGGWNNWDNIVTACVHCNKKKGNRTPEEANMKLRKKPKAPTIPIYLQIMRNLSVSGGQWNKYLFMDTQ